MAYSQCKKSDFSQQLLKVLSIHKRKSSKLVSSEPSRHCFLCCLKGPCAMHHAPTQHNSCTASHMSISIDRGLIANRLPLNHFFLLRPDPYQYHGCSDIVTMVRKRKGAYRYRWAPLRYWCLGVPEFLHDLYKKTYRMGVPRYSSLGKMCQMFFQDLAYSLSLGSNLTERR